jgi:low affinity Fe/Cu permease
MQRIFDDIAQWASRASETAIAFSLAIFFVTVWAVTGPLFHFSDTWRLVINTMALQIKLDELIRASQRARPELMRVEDLSHEELEKVKQSQQSVPKGSEADTVTPN